VPVVVIVGNASSQLGVTMAVAGSGAPRLGGLQLNAYTVSGGEPVAGTVSLTAAAPVGGALVTLQSTNAATAVVPATVTVAAGQTSAQFTVTTNAVATSQDAVIQAQLGADSRSVRLRVAVDGGAGSVTGLTKISGDN
jgi:hypothetical protein